MKNIKIVFFLLLIALKSYNARNMLIYSKLPPPSSLGEVIVRFHLQKKCFSSVFKAFLLIFFICIKDFFI